MAYIYKLNFDNGDFYIGQTSNLEVRLTNHLSSRGKGSPKLQKAFSSSKYLGHEVLAECNENELNELEQKFIAELNPPLNTLPGGDSLRGLNHPRAKYTKEQIEEVISLYLDPKVQPIHIEELTGVAYGTVMDIVKMRSHTWASQGKEAALKKAREARNQNTIVYDKYNNEYIVNNYTHFEQKHGLTNGTISRLQNMANRDGWSLIKHPVYTLSNEDGEVTLPKPLAKEFLQTTSLSKYQISQLLEKKKASGGWKVSTEG